MDFPNCGQPLAQTAARSPFPSLGKPKMKKPFRPAFRLILVLWFLILISVLYLRGSNRNHGDATPGTTSSSSFSLSHKIHDYYDILTHPHDAINSLSGDHTANIATGHKVAVFIETRHSKAAIPFVLHFATVLGPDWPVVMYTPTESFGRFSTSRALARYQESGRIIIRTLAKGAYFPTWDSVAEFLTDRWMWEDLAPAEHVFIFQSDSMICSNSRKSVEDYFEWDLIGAPIEPKYGVGYSGGLSLRNRETMLRVLGRYDWSNDKKIPGMRTEDQWYYARLQDLKEIEHGGEIEDGIRLPSMEIARTFAEETISSPHPLGLHRPTIFVQNETQRQKLDEWCPEYKLAWANRIPG